MTLKKTLAGMLLALLGFLAVSPAHAAYTADQMQQIAELKKTYPLATCVVSGDKLEGGDMGEPIDYLYTQKGADGKETTRLVRFCCPSCPKKFNKDPEKYLKMIDDAAKAKAAK